MGEATWMGSLLETLWRKGRDGVNRDRKVSVTGHLIIIKNNLEGIQYNFKGTQGEKH